MAKSEADKIIEKIDEIDNQIDNEDAIDKSKSGATKKKVKIKKKVEKKVFKPPTDKQLKSWFGHIREIKVSIYIIETKIEPMCNYCEMWKNSVYERPLFYKLNQLLGLEKSKVIVEEVLCDWNCIHATEYTDQHGIIRNYPAGLDIYGENYVEAYGMDIENFPAIRIELTTNRDVGNPKKKGNKLEPFIRQIEGIGDKKKSFKRFQVGKKIYKVSVEEQVVEILKPLLNFLRSLSDDHSMFSTHEKFTTYMGHYHRHSDKSYY